MSKQLTTNRMLTWVYGDYGSFIPQRSVADRLIGRYLNTFEKIYRIVHVPSFRRCYDLYWSGTNHRPIAFILQMQLCMALGALSYDDDYSLRPQALQWIREATFWLEFGEQARTTISTLQSMCLLGLARSMNSLHGDRAWVFGGALIRSAMSIGMHRDPTKLPGILKGEVEMRRRIWATILELTLDSCLDAGGLPLIATSDFDCAAPMNVNDEDFDPAGDHSPVPRRPDQLTDMSLQIARNHSFETRLAIVNFSNGLGTLSSYERALSLGSDYTAARRTAANHLRAVRPGISKFEQQYYEMLMSRYIFALHMPYVPAALQDPKYLYSRSICADTAVKLLHSGLPFQFATSTPLEAVRTMSGCAAQCDEYIRLALCASGPVRSTLFQAIMAVSGDLLAMVDTASSWVLFHDRSSLRTVELLSLLQMSVEWARGRILCGQANVKDYVFLTATFASVEARMAGDSEWEKMRAKGLDACIEAKKILEGFCGARAPSSGESACWQGGLGADDFWASYLDGLDTEFLVPLT
ncbi:hypothetical protein NW767_006311 [Fusarium falciforme]|nr:hypothetical protein NW767_006311 [Fusarium falciforme]